MSEHAAESGADGTDGNGGNEETAVDDRLPPWVERLLAGEVPGIIAPLFDGFLAGALAILLVRSTLGTRPLALPTGGSSAGVVLLASLVFAAGIALSLRPRLVERGEALRVNILVGAGSALAASLVVLPAAGYPLENWTVGVAEPFVGTTLGSVGLVFVLFTLAVGYAVSKPSVLRRRVGAGVIDGIVSLVLTYILVWLIVPAVWRPAPTGATWGEIGGIFLGLFICGALARIPFEAYNGGSIGKYVTGIRVRRLEPSATEFEAEESAPGIRAVLIRNACRPIDSLPFWYVVGLGYIGATDGQRIGDVVAETAIMRAEPGFVRRRLPWS